MKDLSLFFKKSKGVASELTLSACCDAAFNDSETGKFEILHQEAPNTAKIDHSC
jgi:hypothetical protein